MDYKGLDKNQLLKLVDDLTVRIKLVEKEKQKLNQQLNQLTRDGLTGLYSHRVLFDMLKECITQSAQSDKSFSVFMFDLDDFKRVNEMKGHLFGDKVLQQCAALITSCIKDTDIAGRYGGEEFLVILKDTKLSEAINIAENIRLTIEYHYKKKALPITISGGLEEFHQGDRVSDLIQSLDIKLYVAKRQGKNRIVY